LERCQIWKILQLDDHILSPSIHFVPWNSSTLIVAARFVCFDSLTALGNQPRVLFAGPSTPQIIRASSIFDLRLLFSPDSVFLAHHDAGRGTPIAKFQ
jgi:hypothetical protein